MSDLVNPVLLRLTMRATMGRKRALIFAIAPIIMIGVSALLKLVAKSPVWPPEFLGVFGFTVVVPLTALIIGTSVLGAEIDDNSVISLLATPIRRSTVVLTKFVAAAIITVIFAAVGEYLAGAIATGPGSKLALRLLSVDQYALGIANSIAHESQLHAHLTLGTAVAMGVVVTCLALAFAAVRLRSFSLKGDA